MTVEVAEEDAMSIGSILFWILIAISLFIICSICIGYILWIKLKQFMNKLMEETDQLLTSQIRNILGDRITSTLRSFLVIIGGRYGICTTNSEWYQILFAILYFFSPIDFIPDIVPIIGFFDDIFMIYWVGKNIITIN